MPREFWGKDGQVALKPPEFVEHLAERLEVMRKQADPKTGDRVQFTAEMLWMYSELEQVIAQMGPLVGMAATQVMDAQVAEYKARIKGGNNN